MTNLTAIDHQVAQEFVQQARKFLRDEYLPKIERCLEKLDDEQIWWRSNSESNSIGNLLLHLCGNARQWIISGLGGELDQRERQGEFDQREIISRTELTTRLRATIAEVDRVLNGFEPDRLLIWYKIQNCDVTALEAIFHVIEHFSMHTGQVIVLTKQLTAHDLRFYDFADGVPAHNWIKVDTE